MTSQRLNEAEKQNTISNVVNAACGYSLGLISRSNTCTPQQTCGTQAQNLKIYPTMHHMMIEWDSSHPTQHSTTKCTCTTGCSSGRCSCFKNCSVCTAKCRCSQCNNLHNDGNHCSKCSSNDTDESESEESGNEISNNELDDIYMSSGDEL